MSVGLKHSHYWEEPPASHAPHDWRAVDPRFRRLLLRRLLPEEASDADVDGLQDLLNLLDDLDQI